MDIEPSMETTEHFQFQYWLYSERIQPYANRAATV